MTTTAPGSPLAVALAAFQSAMPTIPKTKTATVPTKGGGAFTYTYASLPDVTEQVMPELAKHGLAFSVCPLVTERGPVVEGVLMHRDGERLVAELPLYGDTPQALGSSLTYARRYLLGAMTGVVTDDDDDGNTAEQHARRARQQPARPATQAAGPAEQPRERRGQPGNPATREQRTAIADALAAQGVTDRDTALRTITALLDGVQVASTADLTQAQAAVVLDALNERTPTA